MSNDYLKTWLMERAAEWDSIGLKLRDLSFVNQDAQDFAVSVWRQTDAKATECRAILKVISAQPGQNDA